MLNTAFCGGKIRRIHFAHPKPLILRSARSARLEGRGAGFVSASNPTPVMAGLDPAIHAGTLRNACEMRATVAAWMPATSAGMTPKDAALICMDARHKAGHEAEGLATVLASGETQYFRTPNTVLD
ncbi:hypothetical protein F7D13_16005 [Methylocystis rosea]|uniref:Uncharacterized protein n=1 Tax=Methylocystis rosea TaxID=173366 RepID=A0ABX6EL05_9HYPH|nr:hypothetical protein [Methylocystis rosea]QGM95419.1 hypothetical protein F7D13_16005 [Methylocystis rosea]